MMKKRIFMALLAAASAFVMTSCGDDKDDDPKPESFDVPKESKYTETAEGVYVTYPYPDAENPVCSYTIGYKFEGDKVTEYTYVIVCADAVTAKAVKDSWDTSKISNIKQDGNTVTVYYPLQENISKELAIVGIRALGKVNGVEVPADAQISTEAKYTETENSVSCKYPNSTENPTCSYTFEYKFDGDKVTEYTTTIECQSAVLAATLADEFVDKASVTQTMNTVIVSYPVTDEMTKENVILGIRAIAKEHGCEGVPADAE